MRLEHLTTFAPRCPVCLAGGGEADLAVDQTLDEDAGHVLAGTLRCPTCTREFPIVDGVPVVLAELRAFDSADFAPAFLRALSRP